MVNPLEILNRSKQAPNQRVSYAIIDPVLIKVVNDHVDIILRTVENVLIQNLDHLIQARQLCRIDDPLKPSDGLLSLLGRLCDSTAHRGFHAEIRTRLRPDLRFVSVSDFSDTLIRFTPKLALKLLKVSQCFELAAIALNPLGQRRDEVLRFASALSTR